MLPLPSRDEIAARFRKVFSREMEASDVVYLEHVPTPFYDELWIVVDSGIVSVAERCVLQVERQSVEVTDNQSERILLASSAVAVPAPIIADSRTVFGGLEVAVYLADGEKFAINNICALDPDAETAFKNSLQALASALPFSQLSLIGRWMIQDAHTDEQ